MNRFNNLRDYSWLKRVVRLIPILLFAILFALFLYGVNNVSESSLEKQRESLETALHRDIVHCYAVEGSYPPSLDYLFEHYGLIYNKDLFFVDYQPLGSNMMPDVTVITKHK